MLRIADYVTHAAIYVVSQRFKDEGIGERPTRIEYRELKLRRREGASWKVAAEELLERRRAAREEAR